MVFQPSGEWGRVETTLLFAVKVGIKEYLDPLVDGHLRFQPLKFYRRLEERAKAHHDQHEGLAGVLQHDRIKIVLGGPSGPLEIDAKAGLVDQVIFMRGDDRPVFCLHAFHSAVWPRKQISEADLPEFQRVMAMPERMNRFGSHVWVIKDWRRFTAQLRRACTDRNVGLTGQLVRYVRRDEAHGFVPPEMAAFVKLDEFADEREYRFVLDIGQPVDGPFVLDVGQLRDVTEVVSMEEFRRSMSVGYDFS